MRWGEQWGMPWGVPVPSPPIAQGVPTDGSLWSLIDGAQPGSLQLFPDTSGGAELETIEHAVIISLFTDARASDQDVIPDGTQERRGWWADPAFGSKLWLLKRAALTSDTVQSAKRYAAEALAWMVDEGLASELSVDAERTDEGIDLTVRVGRGDAPDLILTFDALWDRWQ